MAKKKIDDSKQMMNISDAKKEMMKMRFRRSLGESVLLHRFKELKKSVAVSLTVRENVRGGDA